MFSFIAKSIGQVLGEAAHQADKLVDDIMNIPTALAEGYREEIFTADAPKTTEVTIKTEATFEEINTEVTPDVAKS